MAKKDVVENLPKKRRWFRRIARFLVWFVLVVMFLIIGVVLFLNLFPKDKAGQLVTERLTHILGMPAAIESVSVNPLGRVNIDGIRLGEETKPLSFSMNHLGVRFRILPLFARRLEVASVTLDRPEIRLTALPITPEEEATPDSLLPPLPVSFGLFRLVLNDFSIRLVIPDTTGETVVALNHIHLDVKDLYLPRDLMRQSEAMRGEIKMVVESGDLVLQNPAFDLRLKADLNLDCAWWRGSQWRVSLGLSVESEDSDSRMLLYLGADGKGYAEEIALTQAKLLSNEQVLLDLAGTFNRADEGWSYNVNFGGDVLDLDVLQKDLESTFPPSITAPLEGMTSEGDLRLLSGKVWGDENRMQVQAVSELVMGRVSDDTMSIDVHDGRVELTGEVMIGGADLGRGCINLGVSVDSATITLPDTISLHVKSLAFEANSELDSMFLPMHGKMQGIIGEVLGGTFQMQSEWSTDDAIKYMSIDGALRADSLMLELLPSMPEGICGSVTFKTDISVRGIDDIRASMTVQSPGLTYPFGDASGLTPRIELTADTYFHADEVYREWSLDSALIHVDEIVKAFATGWFDVEAMDFYLRLDEGCVKNDQIIHYLPSFLQEQVEGMNLYGEEWITGMLQGRRVSDSMMVALEGSLAIKDMAFTSVHPMMDVRRVNGLGTIAGDLAGFGGKVDVTIGSIALPEIREAALEGGRAYFNWIMSPEGRIGLDDGHLEIKSIGALGNYEFLYVPGRPHPRISGDVSLAFTAEDTVEVVSGITAIGGVACRLQAKTLAKTPQALRAEGVLQLDSLNLQHSGLFNVSGICGQIPFSFDGDISSFTLFSRADEQPLELDVYGRRRTAYLGKHPGIGTVRMGSVELAGYRSDRIWMDIYVGSGFIQIPAFNIDVFGGNLGGYTHLDILQGLDKVRYELHAQASRINSAALLPRAGGLDQENELNATLSFQGEGFDVVQGIDVEGTFHITKIGPKFASTLLKSLDPTGSDRSIRMTRRLLNTGWKPKLFYFEMRHGYVYPSISLSQPWFSPIRIPGSLEYARLPIAFFLTSLPQ